MDGQYIPRLRPGSHRRLPEHNWVWSPQGIIDMHAPEKWGYLQFSAHSGGGDTVAYVPPADESLRAVLWKVYDAQKWYQKHHHHYAGTLQELGIPAEQSGVKVEMSSTAVQFYVTGSSAAFGGVGAIDQDGKVVMGMVDL